jgi:glutamyl-tRNA synthetase
MNPSESAYRGRLAPSPTGYLHLGHARTFWTAQQRAKSHHGTLILRNDDLDQTRCRPEFVAAMLEDLRWFGFQWSEGPDGGGPLGPYVQSQRYPQYRAALEELRAGNFIYPCTCSRKDIQAASRAPHAVDDEEPIYPGTCRPRPVSDVGQASPPAGSGGVSPPVSSASPRFSWRFRVPDGEVIDFVDLNLGPLQFVAGRDFGDFVVWRHDDVSSYQLACAVDDAAMGITEVVRGADLLLSTARQLLLYRALRLSPPDFYHCELVLDEAGKRLAKRHDALSLRALRAARNQPLAIQRAWGRPAQ